MKITAEQFTAVTEPLSSICDTRPPSGCATCSVMDLFHQCKTGYLARMLARRVRMRDELNISISLSDLAEHHLDVNLEGTSTNNIGLGSRPFSV